MRCMIRYLYDQVARRGPAPAPSPHREPQDREPIVLVLLEDLLQLRVLLGEPTLAGQVDHHHHLPLELTQLDPLPLDVLPCQQGIQ